MAIVSPASAALPPQQQHGALRNNTGSSAVAGPQQSPGTPSFGSADGRGLAQKVGGVQMMTQMVMKADRLADLAAEVGLSSSAGAPAAFPDGVDEQKEQKIVRETLEAFLSELVLAEQAAGAPGRGPPEQNLPVGHVRYTIGARSRIGSQHSFSAPPSL